MHLPWSKRVHASDCNEILLCSDGVTKCFSVFFRTEMCGSRKYPYSPPPQRKGSDFPGGRGVNLPNFPVGRGGGHHREIFPEGSRDA